MAIEIKDTSKENGANPLNTPPPSSSSDGAFAIQGIQLLERRLDVRYPTRDLVEVQILGEPMLTRLGAIALDVSRSGLRIELRSAVSKGSQVEIILAHTLIIFGEVRYCRRVGEAFHAGVLIQQVVRPRPLADEHLHDDLMSLYLVGKGLTLPEVIRLKEHLIRCETCQARLAETNSILNPVRKRKNLGGVNSVQRSA